MTKYLRTEITSAPGGTWTLRARVEGEGKIRVAADTVMSSIVAVFAYARSQKADRVLLRDSYENKVTRYDFMKESDTWLVAKEIPYWAAAVPLPDTAFAPTPPALDQTLATTIKELDETRQRSMRLADACATAERRAAETLAQSEELLAEIARLKVKLRKAGVR